MSELDNRVALLRARVAEANAALESAVVEMEKAVAELAPVLRGDKRMTSETVDRSFNKLKTARSLVQNLETMLATALATPRA